MAIQNTFYLDVDIKRDNYVDEPKVTQNDAVTFVLRMTDDGVDYPLAGVSTYTLASLRPDGQSVLSVGTLTDTNEITFELGSTEISVPGNVKAAIQLYDVDGRVSSIPFTYEVTKDIAVDYIPSAEEETLIQLVLGEGPAILNAAELVTAEANEFLANNVRIGEYDNATVYEEGNEVGYDGSSYVALGTTQGNLPTDAAFWALRARKGQGDVNSVNGVRPDGTGDVTITIPDPDLSGLATKTELQTLDDEVASHLEDFVTVKQFGAIGDGQMHPLSEVYPTLALAQMKYPHATTLTDSIDWAAIQLAINYVESKRGKVIFPDSHYVITRSLKVPSFITLEGASPLGVVIDNQYTTLNAPQVVNKDPNALIYTTVKNIVFRGGTYGIKLDVSIETSGNRFLNVVFELQTVANFQLNKLLQTTTFENCTFDGADYGLVIQGFTSNANNFINCSFTNHAWSHVTLRSSEVNNFIGCRFEGGGQLGRATIDVTDTRNLAFEGCYFEGTHSKIISETGSTNSVSFDNCHFTGSSNGSGGFTEYTFESDGMIIFGSNSWHQKSKGSDKMFVKGTNNNMLGDNNTLYLADTNQHKHMISKWIPCPSTLQKDLLIFARTNTSGALTNIQMLTGVLTINYFGLESGGFEKNYSRRYHVKVSALGGANINGSVVLDSSDDSAGGTTLTIQKKTGATTNSLIIEAIFTGLNPSTQISSAFQYAFEFTQMSTLASDTIFPKLV